MRLGSQVEIPGTANRTARNDHISTMNASNELSSELGEAVSPWKTSSGDLPDVALMNR